MKTSLIRRTIRKVSWLIAMVAPALLGTSARRASAQVGHWNSIGPSYIDDHALGTTGVLFSIALDPTDSQTIYVGSHHTQGVWKTTDGVARGRRSPTASRVWRSPPSP